MTNDSTPLLEDGRRLVEQRHRQRRLLAAVPGVVLANGRWDKHAANLSSRATEDVERHLRAAGDEALTDEHLEGTIAAAARFIDWLADSDDVAATE